MLQTNKQPSYTLTALNELTMKQIGFFHYCAKWSYKAGDKKLLQLTAV